MESEARTAGLGTLHSFRSMWNPVGLPRWQLAVQILDPTGEMGCGLAVGLQSQEAGELRCGVSLSIVLVCVVYSCVG